MIEQINHKVPEGEKVHWFFWGTEIKKRHHALYPDSKLVPVLNTLTWLMVASFLVGELVRPSLTSPCLLGHLLESPVVRFRFCQDLLVRIFFFREKSGRCQSSPCGSSVAANSR